MSNDIRLLMCPPDYFGVEYVINPWMQDQLHAVNRSLARQQWTALQNKLSERARIALMDPVNGLPDLVFTANAALIYRNTAVLSSFRCPERQPESEYYGAWLKSAGFDVRTLPPNVLFEGAGDALFQRGGKPLLWLGHGFRSSIDAAPHLEAVTGVEVRPLHLRDPRFYHLDTCFCPLEREHLMFYPGGFDEQGIASIRQRVPPDRLLALTEDEAVSFTCNAVNIGDSIVVNSASGRVKEWLKARGFHVIETPTGEFIKSGGSAKCLSLRLNEA